MTAFARGEVTGSAASLKAELQSVNRRHLDIKVSLPYELRSFEPEIVKFLSKRVLRGSLAIRIDVKWQAEAITTLRPNSPLISEIKAGASEIAKAFSLDESALFEKLLLSEKELFVRESRAESLAGAQIEELLELLLGPFFEMKRFEGERLFTDILERLSQIEKQLSEVEKIAPLAEARYEERLKERMRALLSDREISDELFIKEVALFAERVDITEEITRLKLHIAHFREKGKREEHPAKALEFLLQEMLRETNTIASKAQDAKIAHLVVDMKSKIDQIKEQLQNIE